MPRLSGDDRVESPPSGVPALELRNLHLEPGVASELGHPLVDIDAEDPTPGLSERLRRNSGSDADIEHLEPVAPRGCGDDGVDHGLGVSGPGTVVACSVRTERLRHSAGTMGLPYGKGLREGLLIG